MLAVVTSGHSTVLGLQDGLLVVLVQDAILDGVSLSYHEVLTSHHHSKDTINAHQLRLC